MNISHKGLGEIVTTFQTEDYGMEAGQFVVVDDNLAQTTSSGRIDGVSVSAERNGHVSVQIGGYARAKYTTATPHMGLAYLKAITPIAVSISSTYVADSLQVRIIDIDETNKTIGFMM